MSVAIEPAAQILGANETAHETTPLGLSCLICSHLCNVMAFLALISSESNLERLGPSKIVTMFRLKTGDSLGRPFVNRSLLHSEA